MDPQSTDEITDLLVAYALDALEPEEHERVSRLLRERPELRATLAELRATVARLPYGLPESAPPPDLRGRVLDRATGRASAPARRASSAGPGIGGRLRGWLFGLGGLAGALLIALAFALSQLSGAQAELARTQAELAAARAESQQIAAVLAQPVQQVRLAGTVGGGTALLTPEGELLLAAELPQLAAGRVYQLWLVEGDQAPVSGGTFTVGPDGSGLIALDAGRPIAGAIIAVTDEPEGGSPGPTTEILIAGQVT